MISKLTYLLFFTCLLGFKLSAQMSTKEFNELTMNEMIEYCEDTSHSTHEFLSIAFKKAKDSEDLIALARVELFQSRDAYMSKDYKLALKQALSAKHKIDSNSGHDIIARCYMRIALAMEEIGAIDQAIKYRKLQRDFLGSRDMQRKAAYLNNFIGNLFVKLDQPDSARIYYLDFLATSIEIGDEHRTAFCRNNLGLTYVQSGLIDSAIVEFEKSLLFYASDTSKRGVSMLSTIYGNLTYAYMKQEEYEKALNFINLSYDLAKERSLPKYYTRAIYLKSRVYNEKGDFKLSNEELSKVYAEKNYKDYFNKDELLLMIDIESRNYAALGNYKKALATSKEQINLYKAFYGKKRLDELYLVRSNFQSLDIQNKLKLEQVISEKRGEQIKFLKQEAEISTFRILLITLLAIMLIGAAAFFIYRLRRKNEIERLSNELLKETNKRQSQRLTETTLNLARKKEFAQGLKEKISELDSLDSSEKVSIKMFVDNELQIDDSLLEMDKLVNQLGDEFFVKLKNKYPKLTENDLKLCGLIRLKLTTKQISIVKSITPQSVKVTKHRLRKKMDIEKGTLIYEFLKNF